MDLSSLKDQVSNLTLYDLKAGVRKVQNGELSRMPASRVDSLTEAYSCDELYRDGVEGQRSHE